MAGYWLHFAKGNTSIQVEDLFRSLGLLPNGQYPGVCQHCGKTGIRYMAHVRQDVADTLARALGNTTGAGSAIERTDEEIDALTVAQLGDKEYKQVDVGCVCVMKYLVDCGVDAGQAERMQREVTFVMHVLQEIASLETDGTPERLADTVAHWQLVATLRRRVEAINKVKYWDEPALNDPTARNEYFTLRTTVRAEYDKAAERWKREAHGCSTYFTTAITEAQLVHHYNQRLTREKHKLSKYQSGAQYV